MRCNLARLPKFRRVIHFGLCAAVLIGAGLRCAGLAFGAGSVLTPRSDEEIIRLSALRALDGDLNPHYAVWGHLFHNLYTLLGLPYIATIRLFGGADTWVNALAEAYGERVSFSVLGRAISATAGALTIVAAYQIGQRLFRSRVVGLGAAIILSTAFLHVRDSHFATADILATCAGTFAIAQMCWPRATCQVRSAFRAGAFTGVALAAKLSTAPLVPAFLSIVVFNRASGRRNTNPARLLVSGAFLVGAIALAIMLQPFMVLDPMQTIYGIFGDLFGPDRRPFVTGIEPSVAKVMVRYYVPQAVGWLIGGLAGLGAFILLIRPRHARERWLLVYAFWLILPLVTVRQTYLRYLDPLLPLASLFAAVAIYRCAWPLAKMSIRRRYRLATLTAVFVLASMPNLYRCILLDHRLSREDTRSQAKSWIERNIPSGSRVFWIGFGSFAPHLSMSWLYPTDAYERQVVELRRAHGLPTRTEEAILVWKAINRVRTYDAVAVAPTVNLNEVAGWERFPLIRRSYDIAVVNQLDRWGRQMGLVNDETPYGELMRRNLAGWSGITGQQLTEIHEPWLVITRLPPHLDVLDAVGPQYECVQTFSPEWVRMPDDPHSGVVYDWGDAWWLPNIGIEWVARPGPEIHIFRLRRESIGNGQAAD